MRDTKFDLVSVGSAAAEAAITLDLAWEGAVQAERGRAKSICTIGPASNSEAAMRDLMRLGMDVARLNFSHGTHHEHARNIARLRRAAKKEQRTISILQDLEGPKIRTGRLKSHSPLQLAAGSRVTLTPRQLPGTDEIISTNFPGLASEVGPGSTILLSDGLSNWVSKPFWGMRSSAR